MYQLIFLTPKLIIFYFFFSKWKLHRRKDLVQFTEKSLPGVSILKPLVNSADPSLFQNLETFFLLDYPKYEIIFCIQCTESEDSRLKMYLDGLRKKYPSVQSKVFYGGESVSINPKINNMHPQITQSHGPPLAVLTRAPVGVHPVGAVGGLVRFLPLPLGPPVVLSASHSHLVPNGFMLSKMAHYHSTN